MITLTSELAIEYDLLPWQKGSVTNAAAISLKRWQSLLGSGETVDSQILHSISDFISKHGDS